MHPENHSKEGAPTDGETPSVEASWQSANAEPREASLAEYRDESLGVCIVLTAAELQTLGVDPRKTSGVLYWVDQAEQQLKISSSEQDGRE